MKFLFDQSADARMIPYLVERGHGVTRIARDYPAGLPDVDVLDIAHREERVLITYDRDFGELVFVQHRPHAGVILLRLGSPPSLDMTIARLGNVLSQHAHELDQFIVVTPHLIRVRR